MNVPKDYKKFKPANSEFTEANFRSFIKEYESGRQFDLYVSFFIWLVIHI